MSSSRTRLRDLGVRIGRLEPGPLNAITDVAGVEVGHVTVRSGASGVPPGSGPARTGVTVIWPHRDDLVRNPVAAGFFALSGNGEMTGRSTVEELGRINTPIGLTNTMSVGLVYDAICRYLVERDPGVGDDDAGVQIPVVAECNESRLHDARGFHITAEHVFESLGSASGGRVAEGCVGAGTGMHCFQFKGGIGTSSRRVDDSELGWTVGVLVLTNFGRRPRLTVAGVPVGQHFPLDAPVADSDDGSGIVVVATDAPLDARQLARVAKRASLGLGRTGSTGADGSGELLLAFSTTYRPNTGAPVARQEVVEGVEIDLVFEAAVDATEEAVLNALCMAETTDGRYGRSLDAIPLDELRALLQRFGRI
jgi:D-aminopeptidase